MLLTKLTPMGRACETRQMPKSAFGVDLDMETLSKTIRVGFRSALPDLRNNADGYDAKSMKYQSLLEDLRYLLFSFRGRITRSEWWIYVLLRAGVFLVPAVILLIKKGTSGIPNVYGLTNLWEFFEYLQDSLMSLVSVKLYVSLLLTFF